jgi:hypothetical protein
MLVTRLDICNASTEKGGYTNKQIALARKITGIKNNVISKLAGIEVDPIDWQEFIRLGQLKSKKQAITEWKEKKKKKKSDNKQRKLTVSTKASNVEFFASNDWLRLRVKVLEKYGASCMMCGRNYKEDKVKIHVDHIKPRSKHPELSLDVNNLQILCADCNLGKGNRYETDYRPV